MIRCTSIGILAAALLVPGGVRAAQSSVQEAAGASAAEGSDTKIQLMNVEIWPEYDEPRVLLIYRGALEPGLTTPRDFSFLVPTGAEVHMAGAIDENGGHIHGLYETKDRGDGLTEVSYSLPNPNFYMEFYYDPLGDDDLRDFSYPLVSPFPISRLLVSVQHPRRAAEFAVAPVATRVVQDNQGLSYHVVSFDSVAAGESRSVSIRYRKSDREPSIVAPDGPGAPESDKLAMKIILSFSALLLVGVVGYGIFATKHKRVGRTAYVPGYGTVGRAAQPAADVPTARSYGGAAPNLVDDAGFCTQCGERTAATDNFCGMCGHPVGPGGTHAA